MASKLFLAVTLTCFVAFVRGYGSGAPPEACVDMIPQHPVPPQTTPPPYTITTSTKVVKAGTPMEVVISGKTPSDTMRGLLLQARLGNEPVGSFKIPPAAADFAQLLNCGTPDNAVTHKKHDPQNDKNVVAFIWTPPPHLKEENIVFRATVARDGAVFWVGVQSAPVKVV